jgi:hypothetical protein
MVTGAEGAPVSLARYGQVMSTTDVVDLEDIKRQSEFASKGNLAVLEDS